MTVVRITAELELEEGEYQDSEGEVNFSAVSLDTEAALSSQGFMVLGTVDVIYA